MRDVTIVGAGLSGMATAARLQKAGLSTAVLEAHGHVGGCAGYFSRKGFAFDVGATTLVDFSHDGVGGELLDSLGIDDLDREDLPGYVAWLPDRRVTLYHDRLRWRAERRRALGDSPQRALLWNSLDRLADAFWPAARRGLELPAQNINDWWKLAAAFPLRHWPLARYLNWTMGDLLRSLSLHDDKPLRGLLAMLIEDTVHGHVDSAPLINASLGLSIRGAGLSRARGGMLGFWRCMVRRYRQLGGELHLATPVSRIQRMADHYVIHSRRGSFRTRQVVSAIPIEVTAAIAPSEVSHCVRPYLSRDQTATGGALVLFLGVPEHEVAGHSFTHHQLLQDYDAPLGNGNNMFISVSSPGDTVSAPAEHRAVMISTHCELSDWEKLDPTEYERRKRTATRMLLSFARRVYPHLGEQPVVCELATPATFERFTHRPRGAVGGFRQTLQNSNQNAIPHRTPLAGFWLGGDTTWPGLGTVACVLRSRIIAERVIAGAKSRKKETHEPDRCELQGLAATGAGTSIAGRAGAGVADD